MDNNERFERVIRAAEETAGTTKESLRGGSLAPSSPLSKDDEKGLPVFALNLPFGEGYVNRMNERLQAGYLDPQPPLIESRLFDATWYNSSVGMVGSQINRQRIRDGATPLEVMFGDDRSYTPTADEVLEVAEEFNLTADWFDHLASARSPEDLRSVATALQTRKRRQELIDNSHGLPAGLVKFSAYMSDPSFVALGAGTGTMVKVANASTKFGTALRSSAAAVMADAPLEAYRLHDDGEATPFGAALAVTTSGLFSAALGGILGRNLEADELKALEDDLSFLAGFDSSVGARQNHPIYRDGADGRKEVEGAPARQEVRWSSPTTWFGTFVPVQKLQQSKSEAARKLAARLTWNPQVAGRQDATAFEVQRRISEGLAAHLRPYKEAEKAFFAGQRTAGVGPARVKTDIAGTNTNQRKEFTRLVWRHMNGVERSTDPNVLKAATALSDMQLEAVAYAQSRSYAGGDLEVAKEINARVKKRLEQEAKARQAAAEGKGAGDAAEAGVPAKEPKKNPYLGRKSFRTGRTQEAGQQAELSSELDRGVIDAAIPASRLVDGSSDPAWTQGSLEVVKNPTKRDLQRLSRVPLEERAELGGQSTVDVKIIIGDDGNVYAFPGHKATHQQLNEWAESQGIGTFRGEGRDGEAGFVGLRDGKWVHLHTGQDVNTRWQRDPNFDQAVEIDRRFTDQNIGQAADEIAEELAEYDGWDAVRNIVHAPDYLPRKFSPEGLRGLIARDPNGEAGVIRTLSAAIYRANPERFGDNIAKADTVAKHYLQTLSDVYLAPSIGPRFARKTFQNRKEAMDAVREALKEQGKDVDEVAEEAMELMLEELAPLQRAVSESDRAKPRMKLDLTAEYSKDLTDMFEQDALVSALNYGRTMSGYAGMNRIGFNSVSELNKVIDDVSEELKLDPDAQKVTDTLTYWRDSILGIPSEQIAKSGAFSWAGSQMRRMNFSFYMNNVGFAALSEIGGIALRLGPLGFMRSFREYRGYMKRVRSGDLTLADEVYMTSDAMMGHGTGMLRAELSQATQRYDFDNPEIENPFHGRLQNTAERIDTFTRKSANAVSRVSAMAPLQQFMRMTYVSALAEDMAKKAAKGELPFSKRRMETMGLDEDLWNRIAENLRNSPTTRSPDTGREIPVINHREWADREAADAFFNALDRDARRVVLEGDLGHAPRALRENQLMGLMFQFMSFPINAWTKHSGYLGNVKDGRAFAEMLIMSMMGSVGVQARTFLQGSAITDPERREKFFEERMNPRELAKSAFYYSAHASLLPNAYDTVLSQARNFGADIPEEYSFGYSRNSGLASGLITGNPTIATLDRVGRVVFSDHFYDDGGSPTKQDVQQAMKLLPFGNHVGAVAVSEWLMSGMPEDELDD